MRKKLTTKLGLSWFLLISGMVVFFGGSVWGSLVLDVRYRLEVIQADPLPGELGKILDPLYQEALKDYFESHSRFFFQRPGLPSLKRDLGPPTRLKTQLFQVGNSYLFEVQWFLMPPQEEPSLLGTVSFRVDETDSMLSLIPLKKAVAEHLDVLLQAIPFLGTVTGRHIGVGQETFVINLGQKDGVKEKDLLDIGSLERVDTHPKEQHRVLRWEVGHIGRGEVIKVEENLAFVKVLEEASERKIHTHQKVLGIAEAGGRSLGFDEQAVQGGRQGDALSKSRTPASTPEGVPFQGSLPLGAVDGLQEASEVKSSNLGWLAFGGSLGSEGRTFNQKALDQQFVASGLAYGGSFQGELWLDLDWLLPFSLDQRVRGVRFQQWVGGNQVGTGIPMNGQSLDLRLELAYRLFRTAVVSGPSFWLSLGYHSRQEQDPSLTSQPWGGTSWKSLIMGLGGSLSLWESWGIFGQGHFKLLGSLKQNWIQDTPTFLSDFDFLVGATYFLHSHLSLRLGLKLESRSADFSDALLSQTSLLFQPSLSYAF